ncbi:lipoprotein [Streptomyces glaucosporus]|uniref:Lipoprotein n=1 Tax=Streptomyces glaucosporus TaxID=284044 RepID=A0ABN3IDP5_9ACTN
MSVRRKLAVATLVCMGAAGLTACGNESDEPFEGQSADKVAEEAVKATRDASSVRVKGTVRQEGARLRVDFHVDERDNCRGALSARGARADVVRSGRAMYVKGDETFWNNALGDRPGSRQAVEKLRDRWVKSDPDRAGLRGVCDKQEFLAALDSDKSERRGMRKSGTAEVEGKEAVVLEKEQPGGERLTLYVAAEGEPYILKAVSKGGEAAGETVFTDYNEKVHAEKPPAGQVVEPAGPTR